VGQLRADLATGVCAGNRVTDAAGGDELGRGYNAADGSRLMGCWFAIGIARFSCDGRYLAKRSQGCRLRNHALTRVPTCGHQCDGSNQ
jgi:hypothetical protein